MKLKLQIPLDTFSITQRFGNKNPALYGDLGHNGIDFYAKHGTPIYATHDGLASYQVDAGGGHGVVIITDKQYEDDKGNLTLFKTLYWHIVDPLKEPKYASPLADKTGFTPVKTGDIIAYIDNTGRSTGDHLHFGLKPVAKGESWGAYYNLEQNNGYYGAIDPMPYFVELPPYIKNGVIRFGFKDMPDTYEIHTLQALLIAHGYKINVDGVFGRNTLNIVKKFQEKKGLVLDGVVGLNTWKALYTF